MALAMSSFAQLYKLSFDPVIRTTNGEVLELALAGGLNQPQFSNMDFNNDGMDDLFVFDRTGAKILVFINESDENGVAYRYDPNYEEFFPKGTEYMILKDYNDDEKPDLWTYSGDSVVLYKNFTTSYPDFRQNTDIYALDSVNYVSWNPFRRISHVQGCLPGIEDLDNDGDIDIVTNLNSSGSAMILFLNSTADSGKALDDISYVIPDKCYGGIDEWNGYLTINSPCQFRERYLKNKKKHFATKTMLFFDEDGDGDMDLLYGSSERETNPVYFFKNGKVELGDYYKDTFISIDTAFFSSSVEPLIPVAPAMSYVDVDGDGNKDLILSTNEAVKTSYAIRETNNVLYFRNKETTSDPNFEFQSNTFLNGEMVDLGGHNAPTFADLDGDNDLDMVIATSGNHFISGDTADYLVYYENIGSSTDPDYKLVDNDFLSLKAKKYVDMVVTFADVNSNGLLDMYIGKDDGTIAHYRNIGSKSNPSYQLVTETLGAIDVGQNATPLFYDLNEDGKLDLISGNYDGSLYYYENTGTIPSPTFTFVTDTLGGIHINEILSVRFLGPNGWIDSLMPQAWGFSAPTICKFNDSVTYIGVGGDEGRVRLFEIDDDITARFVQTMDYMLNPFNQEDYIKDFGERIHPTGADLNGDGITDLMVGNSRGGINYLEGVDTATISVVQPKLEKFYIAPNPSSGSFKVFVNSNSVHQFKVVDLSGRVVKSGNIFNEQAVQISGLSNGIYFVQLSSDDLQYAPERLVLVK